MVNPSRDNLDRAIRLFAESLTAHSLVLDAGSANGPYRHYFDHCKYQTADIAGKVDYKSDLCALPIVDNLFDAVISTQVLEHIKTPDLAVHEIYRILKPGGKLLLTTPFFFEEHLVPCDYFRFTQFGLNDLLSRAGFEIDTHRWLEGFSCATYYFLVTLIKELEKMPADDEIRYEMPAIEKMSQIFLERELSDPILSVGFPKNYIFYCTKPVSGASSARIIDRVRGEKLTYLSAAAMHSLDRCLADVKAKGIQGDFYEFGVALGGSAILMASQCHSDRRFVGLDVFGMIPPPGENDDAASHERYEIIRRGESEGILGQQYYGYRSDLLEFVKQRFAKYDISVDGNHVQLLKGRFEDAVLGLAGVMHIAVTHIDCDWYNSVATALSFVAPRTPIGGYIIVDDFSAWGGARKATLEFLMCNSHFDIVTARPHCVLKKMRTSKG
jgi:O-methyltransferase